MHGNQKTHTATKALAAVGAAAVILKGARIGMDVFGPVRPWRLQNAADTPSDSPEFPERLACVVDAPIHRGTQIQVLRNGAEFYPAELEAIDGARETIHLEAYEFLEGHITREFVERLAARAAKGVQVRLTVDAIGSWATKMEAGPRKRASFSR